MYGNTWEYEYIVRFTFIIPMDLFHWLIPHKCRLQAHRHHVSVCLLCSVYSTHTKHGCTRRFLWAQQTGNNNNANEPSWTLHIMAELYESLQFNVIWDSSSIFDFSFILFLLYSCARRLILFKRLKPCNIVHMIIYLRVLGLGVSHLEIDHQFSERAVCVCTYFITLEAIGCCFIAG